MNLENNQLVHLPAGIIDLPDLQSISASDNPIRLREEPDFTTHHALLQRQIGYTFDDARPEDDERSTLVLEAESPDEQLATVRMDGQKLYVTALEMSDVPIRIQVMVTDPLGKINLGFVLVDLKERE